jgi:ribonuclease J
MSRNKSAKQAGGGAFASRPKSQARSQNSSQNPSFLKFTPVGGMGEVTRNMYVYETANDMVVVDCGIGFPDEEEGRENEILLPDFSYVVERRKKLRGLIITHGHEDHIGAIPYFLKKVQTPVYAARLPLGMIKAKLKEKGVKGASLREIHPGNRTGLGADFSFEFIRLTHSIPDTMAIALSTPLGVVIHTGDFKLDPTPLDRNLPELGKIEDYGRRGVLLLASDSLRAEREGSCPTERLVGETLFEEIQKTRGRVFITLFSSDVSRVQQVIDVATALGRKVALAGFSLRQNFEVARGLGYLAVPKGEILEDHKLKKLPVSKQIILTAGSQGQENSALSKMVRGKHRAFKIGQGDFVIFSSDLIPGNESRVVHLQEKIRELGAKVLYIEQIPEIHVSGHGYAADLKRVMQAARAQYIIPIGGTEDSVVAFAKLARGLNYRNENVFLLDNGQTLEFHRAGGSVVARRGADVSLREVSVLQD